MEDKFEWWYESRANSRAILLLTERDDFALAKGSEPGEMDLYISPKPFFPDHSNMLGIQVVGGRKIPETVARRMSAAALKEFELERWHHPACLFLFEADGEEAYYQWLAEPVNDGKSALVKPASASPRKLDSTSVSELFDRVRQWYGSVPAEMAA